MSSIFISKSTSNGFTWTITSRLGHILENAEQKYGLRDYSYTILGIEFNEDGHPRIWYPGNRKHIVIQITLHCLNDINRAIFQVAHEAIHCLSPSDRESANVLEEGLANLFSIDYCLSNGYGVWNSNDKRYTEAAKLVKKLLSFDSNIIKKLRLIQPTISRIDKNLLLEINSNISDHLADNLTSKF